MKNLHLNTIQTSLTLHFIVNFRGKYYILVVKKDQFIFNECLYKQEMVTFQF